MEWSVLTDALAVATEGDDKRRPDYVQAKVLRAILDARQSDPTGLETAGGTEDNPTLSTLFDRWR